MNKDGQSVQGPDAAYTGDSLGEEEETHGDQCCGEIHQRDEAGDSHGFRVLARILGDPEHGPRLAGCCRGKIIQREDVLMDDFVVTVVEYFEELGQIIRSFVLCWSRRLPFSRTILLVLSEEAKSMDSLCL